jgi:succinyl-CoA synthetase beta subunit
VLAELLADVAHLVLPTGRSEIRRAVLGLRCARLLVGHRGAPPAELDALVDVVHGVTALALERTDLVSVEINPVIVTANAAWACDALVVRGEGQW